MNEFKYPHLFEPIRLGNTLFRNRIFASPTGYTNMTGDNILPPGAAAYYARKALGGAASVATCELITDGELGRGGANHVAIEDPRAFNPLCRLAEEVTRHGAVATAELQHAGMFANRVPAFMGAKNMGFAYGPVEMQVGDRVVPEMPEEIIERTIQKYAQAALIAKRAGFGMVLVHAGHGWLLHQFVSPITNTRKDKWGGVPIENRARFTVEIVKAIKKACGAGFPVEVRISGSECYDGGYGIEEGIAFAKQLDGLCDLIHVSAGNHEVEEVFAVTHPSMFLGEGPNVQYAAEIKKHVKTPVATVGALGEPEMLEEIIASGQADVVEMARALLADPDLPLKIRTGREDEIKQCMRCLSCFSTEMNCGEPYCAINPETGRELDMKYDFPRAKVSRRVLVVGGGVGGMQAALTCGERGHQVILCEKASALGGRLPEASSLWLKDGFRRYYDYAVRKTLSCGAEVRLNTPVTPELVRLENPDTLILALGAGEFRPPIPGVNGPNVASVADVDRGLRSVGQRVVVCGGGLSGSECAMALGREGKTVTVVDILPEEELHKSISEFNLPILLKRLRDNGVEMRYETSVLEIGEKGVLVRAADGTEELLEADTVIAAFGIRADRAELEALQDLVPETYVIGDAHKVGVIGDATGDAYRVCLQIE